MNDQEILTQFEELVDDSLSETLSIQLANNAKNKLEREMKLEICKRLDENNTAAAGQTYTTGITLPTGFRGLARDYIWVGSEKRYPKPLEDAPRWRTTSGFFYINHGANTMHLTGTQASSAAIVIPFIFKTADITQDSRDAGTTTITWPTDFHSVIAYEMVKLFDQIERGDKQRSWKPEWELEYSVLKNAMRDWDHDLKQAAISHATPYGPDESAEGEYQINLP